MRVALALTLIVASNLAHGQVVVRQGTNDTSHAFQSPMVIETPLPEVTLSELTAHASSPPRGFPRRLVNADLSKFTCDGVSMPNMTVVVRGTPAGAYLDFYSAALVPESYDREVDIKMILRKGDRILATGSVTRLDAEEGRRTPFRVTLTFQGEMLQELNTPTPAPILEITMVVRDAS